MMPPFALSSLPDVRFEGELGHGIGVTRAFFSYLCSELQKSDDLPAVEYGLPARLTNSYAIDALVGVDPSVQRAIGVRLARELQCLDQDATARAVELVGAALVRAGVLEPVVHKEHVGEVARKVLGYMTPQQLAAKLETSTLLTLSQEHRPPTFRALDLHDRFDLSAVLWQPSRPGFFAPCPSHRPELSNLYRLAVLEMLGRIVGLSLLHSEIVPIKFTRPVLKVLLGRRVNWYDLAFHDPELFESLRKLALMKETEPDSIVFMDLTFEAPMPGPRKEAASSVGGERGALVQRPGQEPSSTAQGLEEVGREGEESRQKRAKLGGDEDADAAKPLPRKQRRVVELKPGGAGIAVTAENVLEYIELYSKFVMVGSVEQELRVLQRGFHSVVPWGALRPLFAEDLRLMLNGTEHVDVSLLRKHVKWSIETRKGSAASLDRIKRWFWGVVDGMTQEQLHNLLHFWTSSSTLSVFLEKPEHEKLWVAIASPTDETLPTANTCSLRLNIPLYSSRRVLRDKLLTAITTKSFGFV